MLLNTKYTIEKLPKTCNFFPTMAKFRQIWSHWVAAQKNPNLFLKWADKIPFILFAKSSMIYPSEHVLSHTFTHVLALVQCDQIGRNFDTLGNFSKPVARIILPKLPTFQAIFKGVTIFLFYGEMIFGQLFTGHAALVWGVLEQLSLSWWFLSFSDGAGFFFLCFAIFKTSFFFSLVHTWVGCLYRHLNVFGVRVCLHRYVSKCGCI